MAKEVVMTAHIHGIETQAVSAADAALVLSEES